MVSSMRRTSGCSMMGDVLAGRRAGGAALPALLGVVERLLVGPLAEREALDSPTDRRALFIIVNM